MATLPSPGSLAERDTPQTWRAFIRARLIEWGPLDFNVFLMRITPLMPPGYAWQVYCMERKMHKALDLDEELPEPTSLEEVAAAQRTMVRWVLRQLRRENMLTERDGTIAFNAQR